MFVCYVCLAVARDVVIYVFGLICYSGVVIYGLDWSMLLLWVCCGCFAISVC